MTWDRALDLIADELKRVIRDRGNHAIYAGSYGWASAGRFHHARTQLQRFLGGIGGFTGARDTYSNAAGAVLVKNVLGSLHAMNGPGTSWKSIADHADLVVMFGGDSDPQHSSHSRRCRRAYDSRMAREGQGRGRRVLQHQPDARRCGQLPRRRMDRAASA